MSQKAYKVRDEDGIVIGQYHTTSIPDKPDDWNGEWDIEEVSIEDFNSEPVEWWDEQH